MYTVQILYYNFKVNNIFFGGGGGGGNNLKKLH
jgi:hypothetical protein